MEMITEFCKKEGIFRFTAEHLVNIFSMIPPSCSPVAVTSKTLLSHHPLSNFITSSHSEAREFILQESNSNYKDKDSYRSQNLYLSISEGQFEVLNLMTCALVPTFLSTHEQTIGQLISIDSFIPSYPYQLSILVLPPESCIFVSPLRLELLLSLPPVENSEFFLVPNLVSRTLMCLHSLVSRSLIISNFDIPRDLSLDSLLDIEKECLSTVHSHRHSLLLPVLQSSFTHYSQVLLFSLLDTSQTLHPLAYLSMKYAFVCLSLVENCFSPRDACLSIMESILFERSIILSMISFSFIQNSGKYIVLSLILRCASILQNFSIESYPYITCLALITSLLQLYDENKIQDEYSPEYQSLLTKLILNGHEILHNNYSSIFLPQTIDVERIVHYESNNKLDPQHSSYPVLVLTSERYVVEVILLFPNVVRKRKYSQSMEKMTIQFLPHQGDLSNHFKVLNLSLRCNLPFKVILEGFYRSQFPLFSRNLHLLVQELIHMISIFQGIFEINERLLSSFLIVCLFLPILRIIETTISIFHECGQDTSRELHEGHKITNSLTVFRSETSLSSLYL